MADQSSFEYRETIVPAGEGLKVDGKPSSVHILDVMRTGPDFLYKYLVITETNLTAKPSRGTVKR